MSKWNHRVVRTQYNAEVCYGIHEAYYDDNGKDQENSGKVFHDFNWYEKLKEGISFHDLFTEIKINHASA